MPIPAPPAGLCTGCRHARRIESARGSVFLLCERSRGDPRFARYPVLPVLACSGFAPTARPGSDGEAAPS